MSSDGLGDRIKRYENAYRHHLTPRSCVAVRVDGRAFHTWTKRCDRPFDDRLHRAMVHATRATIGEMQGVKLAYTQSDEASFLLTDFDTHETQGWFGYNLQKLASVSASAFTAHFNQATLPWASRTPGPATFDARAFVVPTDDAPNAFVWRQRDWERNSVQMLARSRYSHAELHGLSADDVKLALTADGTPWEDLPDRHRHGTFVTRDGDEICRRLEYDEISRLCSPNPEEES